MKRGLWSVAFAVAVLASIVPQAHSQPAQTQRSYGNAVATVTANKNTADAANDEPKGCPGAQYPRLNCASISAQADLEQARTAEVQARQSVRQGNLFTAEVVISAMTMIAAIAAAAFAAVAARAARNTVIAFVKVEDARLVVEFRRGGCMLDVDGNVCFLSLECAVTNVGRSIARLDSFAGEDCEFGIDMTLASGATQTLPQAFQINQVGTCVPETLEARIYYSGPLDSGLCLKISVAWTKDRGTTAVSANIKSARLYRITDEGYPKRST